MREDQEINSVLLRAFRNQQDRCQFYAITWQVMKDQIEKQTDKYLENKRKHCISFNMSQGKTVEGDL